MNDPLTGRTRRAALALIALAACAPAPPMAERVLGTFSRQDDSSGLLKVTLHPDGKARVYSRFGPDGIVEGTGRYRIGHDTVYVDFLESEWNGELVVSPPLPSRFVSRLGGKLLVTADSAAQVLIPFSL